MLNGDVYNIDVRRTWHFCTPIMHGNWLHNPRQLLCREYIVPGILYKYDNWESYEKWVYRCYKYILIIKVGQYVKFFLFYVAL